MANEFTLDEINDKANEEYANLTVKVGERNVVLVNVLQLTKEKRAELRSVQDKIDEDGDTADVLEEAIRIAAQDSEQAEALIDALGGNLAKLATVFKLYNKQTQAGEA